MNDIFSITEEELPKIKQSEFNETVKKLLNNICNCYHNSWHSRSLKDEEFPEESICDKCKGCGTFNVDGEDRECFMDRENGICYQDAEEFGMEVEDEMDNIYGLLGSEIIPNN